MLYDKLLALCKSSTDAAVKTRALYLTAQFSDPALVKRTLDAVAAGEVRNQDSGGVLGTELSDIETRDQAWTYVQQNWDRISAQFTTFSGAGVVSSLSGYCSVEKRDEIASFFKTHPVKAAERALKMVSQSIDSCVELHQAQSANLQTWLATKSMGNAVAGQ